MLQAEHTDLRSAGLEAVEVALPVAVDSLFTYAVPPALRGRARPGHRVLVPFAGRRLTGVVVEQTAPAGARRTGLRALESVLDPAPVVGPAMLTMLREAADEVLCPVGLALAAALPPGTARRSVTRHVLTPRGREALRSGAARGALRALLGALGEGSGSPVALARRVPNAQPLLRRALRDGLVERTLELRGPGAQVPTQRVAAVAPDLDVEKTACDALGRAPRQAALLRHLARRGPTPTAVLARDLPGAAGALRALADRGLVALTQREAARPVGEGFEEPATRVVLTAPQEQALQAIGAAIGERRAARFLLHGVTGSGKTEVYLQAVARALAGGRQALVLVPEITLTHQIVARLRARFGDALAVLHSGLRPGDRLAQWERLRRGDTPIAVGARSALFAPLENLGVIVVDEEHDSAYKNEEGFRYHARKLAARLADAASCPLVLGSATPALETRHAAERGVLQRLTLPHRIGGRPLPAVEIVDMARARAAAPRGRKLILSPRLRLALGDTLARRSQAILFLNRRGFSTRVLCFDCGHAEHCVHCDISLVYHASEQRLRCHYCDYGIDPPERCSSCGADAAALLGIGTERVEEEVRTLFPDARIARLDRDTAARRGATERTLLALRDGRIDILVGTQMVAKGHDFPGVSLVGVILADLALHHPDFRAAERTFQLLTQVAGRAGRGGMPGLVVLQTYVPDHYAIRPVRDHDYETFYREEMQHRAALGYPPLGRLVQVMVSSPELAECEEAARRLAACGAPTAERGGDPAQASDLVLLGPAPAPIARLRDRYRFQLLVKGSDARAVQQAARRLVHEAHRARAPLQVSVDVDPVNML